MRQGAPPPRTPTARRATDVSLTPMGMRKLLQLLSLVGMKLLARPVRWQLNRFEAATRAPRPTQEALLRRILAHHADPRGVGFFGISKGGGAGLFAASRDPYVRCCVTDGAFATYTTLVPYMRHWFRIYNQGYFLQGLLPSWYYGLVGISGLRQIERERQCRFPHLEKTLRHLSPRPLLMIHGEADPYIKPGIARALFEIAREPKEFWLVPGAKHNQALQAAGDEYRRRVLEFFEKHLADGAEARQRPQHLAGPHTELKHLLPTR